MTASAIAIHDVDKIYGSGARAVTALSDIHLDIHDQEFFTLLGPSGCGKTTLLRLIAGFEQPDKGEILLFGEHLEGLEPDQRPVNTVFQNYSLFPHMTIADNIGFGLRMQKRPAAEISSRVAEMLALVKMVEFGERKPDQLSGGQQQRIALARALAPSPKVLLLDEPLSALDLKLRQAMRYELKRLQKETGITFVFVTHDQEEAMSMSDRVAVMSQGRVQQLSTPEGIYENPCNRFVAEFIGDVNLIEATAGQLRGRYVTCDHPAFQIDATMVETTAPAPGASVTLALRPEKMRLCTVDQGNLNVRIVDTMYMGTDRFLTTEGDGGLSLEIRLQNNDYETAPPTNGELIGVKIPDGAAVLLTD